MPSEDMSAAPLDDEAAAAAAAAAMGLCNDHRSGAQAGTWISSFAEGLSAPQIESALTHSHTQTYT